MNRRVFSLQRDVNRHNVFQQAKFSQSFRSQGKCSSLVFVVLSLVKRLCSLDYVDTWQGHRSTEPAVIDRLFQVSFFPITDRHRCDIRFAKIAYCITTDYHYDRSERYLIYNGANVSNSHYNGLTTVSCLATLSFQEHACLFNSFLQTWFESYPFRTDYNVQSSVFVYTSILKFSTDLNCSKLRCVAVLFIGGA